MGLFNLQVQQTDNPTWAQLALYAALVVALAPIAARLAVFLHEVVGHALLGAALGADVLRIELRPFGGGRVWYLYPEAIRAERRIWSASGGLAMDFVGAGLALLGVRLFLRRIPVLSLFLSLYAIRALLGGAGYLARGLYHLSGDPGTVLRMLGHTDPPWLSAGPWIVGLVIVPFGAFVAVRGYLAVQDRFLPSRSHWRRLGRALVSVGLAFSLLAVATKTVNVRPSIAFEADGKRAAQKYAAAKWQQEVVAAYLRKHPGATQAEVDAHIQEVLAAREREGRDLDAPRPWPLLPVLVVLYAVGSIAGLVVRRRLAPDEKGGKPKPIVVGHALLAATIAVLILSALARWPVWDLVDV